MSGARSAVVADVPPDVETDQNGKDKENDYFKAAEVGCKFFEISA